MLRKSLYFIGILMLSAFFTIASEGGAPKLEFEKERQDYGTILLDTLSPGTRMDLSIGFSNTGDAPLVISNVRACCGTRVQDWPEAPIMPGENGIIEANFRLASRAQRINRTVTVTYNNPEQPSTVFRIVGEVVEGSDSEFIQQTD